MFKKHLINGPVPTRFEWELLNLVSLVKCQSNPITNNHHIFAQVCYKMSIKAGKDEHHRPPIRQFLLPACCLQTTLSNGCYVTILYHTSLVILIEKDSVSLFIIHIFAIFSIMEMQEHWLPRSVRASMYSHGGQFHASAWKSHFLGKAVNFFSFHCHPGCSLILFISIGNIGWLSFLSETLLLITIREVM